MNPSDKQRAMEQCAREPIHLIGAIQPHGVLLVYSRQSGAIVAASANAASLFALPDDGVVGHPIDDLLDASTLDAVAVAMEGPGEEARLAARGNFGELGRLHDVSAHVRGDLVHLELEPVIERLAPSSNAHLMIAALEGIADAPGFFDEVARQVATLVGYDRVMVYRFHDDYSGEVIAESCVRDMPAYCGLRFPASDIPPQARALYLRNRIRVIPDATYIPVPVDISTAIEPLDMSFDVLRSVAAVHLDYLRNMGVAASMSVSLIVDGQLWGLIACHHREPRLVPARHRLALDMFSRHVSLILAAREMRDAATRLADAREQRDRLERYLLEMAPADLAGALPWVAAAVPADGVALRRMGAWSTQGLVPSDEGLDRALAWARSHAGGTSAWTDVADDWNAPAGTRACGLGALRLSAVGDQWLLVFRREQRETIRWAGSPDEAFQLDQGGLKIGPRSSFSAWEKQTTGAATPWSEEDRRTIERVRMRLQRHSQLAAAPALAARPEHRTHDWDVNDQARRLRRLATLLEESGGQLAAGQLPHVDALIVQLERDMVEAAGMDASAVVSIATD